MPNMLDLIARAKLEGGNAFEVDFGPEHLAGVPAELAPFAAAWNFVPVDDDPFEDPKDKAERLAKEREAAAKKKAASNA